MHICENGIKSIFNQVFDPMTLFLLLKNAKDSSLAESSCLTLALATHTKKLSLLMAKEEGHTKCL